MKLFLRGNKAMNDWKCPIEDIDEDIRELVKILFVHNMKPYMSCSGSYKDHKNKSYLPECASIEILDSNVARELIAVLIKDKRFKISISKERERVIYDNHLPNGLRFKIEFENICGETQKDLMIMILSMIHGEKATDYDRQKIDMVCGLIDAFAATMDSQIVFSFNDEMIVEGKENDDNYSIKIQDKKDFGKYYTLIEHAVDGFEQDERESKFYGSDFLKVLSTLRKIILDYQQIPRLNPGEKINLVKSSITRINKFTMDYNEKIKAAQVKLEESKSNLFETESVSFEDLMSMF